MVVHVGSREAREDFDNVLGEVRTHGNTVIIEEAGEPIAAVIPLEVYERLVAERESRFQIIDHIKERVPDVSSEEVEADVAEAIAAVRATGASSRS
jgi:prevent-host-death family protein